MKKEKFYTTSNKEAETHIWTDIYSGQVIVETNRKTTYYRLSKKLGEPNKKQYVKEKLVGAICKTNFEDKEKVRQILSKTNIICKRQLYYPTTLIKFLLNCMLTFISKLLIILLIIYII